MYDELGFAGCEYAMSDAGRPVVLDGKVIGVLGDGDYDAFNVYRAPDNVDEDLGPVTLERVEIPDHRTDAYWVLVLVDDEDGEGLVSYVERRRLTPDQGPGAVRAIVDIV